jgi:hypothetical protein
LLVAGGHSRHTDVGGFQGSKNADFVNTLAVVAGDETRHQHNGEKPNESAENLGNEFGYPENLEEFELSPESRAFWYGMYNPLKIQPRRRFIHVAWEIESGPPKP